MSRPGVFDEETCDTCTRVLHEAPYYEGTTVDGGTYCDKCLEKYKRRQGKTAEDDRKREEVWRKEIAKKENEIAWLTAQIIKADMESEK